MTRSKLLLLAALGLAFAFAPPPGAARRESGRYFKGNTHTHTLWSDGDGAPQAVVQWYRERGYDFLALTDHNALLHGERWFPVAQPADRDQRLTPERLTTLRAEQAAQPIETRTGEAREEMRLWTLEELRARYDAPGEFLLIEGEEVTGAFDGRPVHINALGLTERLLPGDGASLSAMMDDTLGSIRAHGRAQERPVIAHVNHPNFQWGIRWDELAAITQDRFFEVYNGHPSVRNAGDEEHPGTEEIWDRALVKRMTELGLRGAEGLLYGVATDDSHQYHEWGPDKVNPGRGWVMVRAPRLDERELLLAMRRGDFYASSGVSLSAIESDARGLRFEIEAEAGKRYRTRFVGTRLGADGPGEIGELLLETDSASPAYAFGGDELYVRAVVEERLPEGAAARDPGLGKAWVQPVTR